MKRSLPLWTLFLASAVMATGCTLPYESDHPHIAQHLPVVQPATNVLPPATMLQHPGPGVGGPGPGVMGVGPSVGIPMFLGAPGASQIAFKGNDGMRVYWDVSGPGSFDSEPLVEPGRYNFPQGAIYRLKLTNIPGRAGVELYPTIEIGVATPRTEAYLAHSSIPFELTNEDFEQVLSGNFVTKVIYLPDAEHQDVVLAGAETLVSTRLEPGKDPIVEAEKRGSIMAIIRIGNKDMQAPGGDVASNSYAGVTQASFHHGVGGVGSPGNCGPDGGCGPGGCGPEGYGPGGVGPSYGGIAPPYVAGVTAPLYGMPSCGTPIGLVGPPHIPLGVPAGLESHTITNSTHMSIPPPVHNFDIAVKQMPGYSYPKPVSHVSIVEATPTPPLQLNQPCADRHQLAPGYNAGCGPEGCPTGGCPTGDCPNQQ